MEKKNIKYFATVLTMLFLLICTIFCTNTVKASNDLPWDDSEIKEISTCVVDGVERSLVILTNNNMYLKVGDDEPIYITNSPFPFKFDKYGTLWNISNDNIIRWKSYDFSEVDESYAIKILDEDGYYSPIEGVESFIFDENKYVIGFKLFSGEAYYTYNIEEIKSIMNSKPRVYPNLRLISSSDNTPTPGNNPTSRPNATEAPTQAPVPTSIPTAPVQVSTPTDVPATTAKPLIAQKISVKKETGFTCIYIGNTLTSKYKLTKGTLAWKGLSKSKKFSAVKYVGFIKKSGNTVFMTKKGQVFTLSPKGKKKCILKSGGKKFVSKNKFVVKVLVAGKKKYVLL